MKILLAEDDSNLAIITQLCLEKVGGHTVEVHADGAAAFNAAMSADFDLILLDGMMPKKSGLQVAIELKQSSRHETPIIFLSAKTEEKDIKEFLSFGIGFISKPYDPQRISALIDEILRNNGAATA